MKGLFGQKLWGLVVGDGETCFMEERGEDWGEKGREILGVGDRFEEVWRKC